ncbi:MAG: hypothetical protein JWM96_403 [Alphaproteobacteria bacterium]|nr:hypothetical protein [Alphaproteobacteria bacterium]
MRILFSCLFTCLFTWLSAQPVFAQGVDWKNLGRPLADDSQNMRDRFVYTNIEINNNNTGLDKPIISREGLADWLRLRVGQLMTLDGALYDSQVRVNQAWFTPTGYADYVIYLKSAGLDKFLKENRFKMASFVEGNPEILSEGPRPDEKNPSVNVYAWQTSVRLAMSYLDYKNQPPESIFKNVDPRQVKNRIPIEAKLELVRVPAQIGGSVVAINHISFAAVKEEAPPPIDQGADER